MLLIVFTRVNPREHCVVDCVYRSGSKRTLLLIAFTGVDPREHLLIVCTRVDPREHLLVVFTGVDPREQYVFDCVYRSGSKRTICF